MAVLINLRNLEQNNIRLAGEIPALELDLEGVDELIRLEETLRYAVEVQKVDQGVLVQGRLELTLACECARCLRPFSHRLILDPWACQCLPLEGEEMAEITNDCVDLTPCFREDILLGFPQQPLCRPECGGLPKKVAGKTKKNSGSGRTKESSSAWAELNKLRF